MLETLQTQYTANRHIFEEFYNNGTPIDGVSAVMTIEGSEESKIDILKAISYIIGCDINFNTGFYIRLKEGIFQSKLIDSLGSVNWNLVAKTFPDEISLPDDFNIMSHESEGS